MIAVILRRVTDGLLRRAAAILPLKLRPWATAMRHELDAVEDDRAALRFAMGCLGFVLARLVTTHLLHPLCWPVARAASAFISGRTSIMNRSEYVPRDPRLLAAFCAVGATGLGLVYLAVAGAPPHYLTVNTGALVLGLLLAWAFGSVARVGRAGPAAAALGLAAILLLTALRGTAVEGAARWIPLGSLAIQPSLLLLPVVAIGFARSRDGLSAAGIVGAALALAIQPDRAMAGVLAMGMMALALMRPDRNVMIALGASMIGFMATLLRPDRLPAVPYVDGILASSFDLHPLMGVAVSIGAALMLAPAIAGWRHDRAHRESHAVFGAVWLGILFAAVLGNYPTPLVGYGGSAILGYALSLVALPRRDAHGQADEPVLAARRKRGNGPSARVALVP